MTWVRGIEDSYLRGEALTYRALTRRLQRLSRNGYYCIAALDHGLSSGTIEGLGTLETLQDTCDYLYESGLPAAVLNIGVLHHIVTPPRLSIVAQIIGMPMYSANKSSRVSLAPPLTALSAGAEAISLQIDPNSQDFPAGVEQLSHITHDAHALGLPVLLMVTGEDWDSVSDFITTIRSLSELGVDLMKVSPGSYLSDLAGHNLASVGVPLLYPGGELANDFRQRLELGGKGGLCRNLYRTKSLPIHSAARCPGD